MCNAQQRGYVLLALLFTMALLVIAAGIAAPAIATEIRRSQEDELIHRAMQYRRAIRRYVKQTGRYPLTIEDLNSGGIRCLRRKYQDPMTGRNFRVLHMLDIPRLTGVPNSSQNPSGVPPENDPAAAPSDASDGTPSSDSVNGTPPAPTKAQVQPAPLPASSGGVIIGVVSTSSKKSIREFNHKDHYNQWLFYYDPAYDHAPDKYGPTRLDVPGNINPGTPPSGSQPQPGEQSQQ